MENVIYILERIRSALGTVQITSTRSNLDVMLGCMQLCDRAINEIRAAQNSMNSQNEEDAQEGEENGEQD